MHFHEKILCQTQYKTKTNHKFLFLIFLVSLLTEGGRPIGTKYQLLPKNKFEGFPERSKTVTNISRFEISSTQIEVSGNHLVGIQFYLQKHQWEKNLFSSSIMKSTQLASTLKQHTMIKHIEGKRPTLGALLYLVASDVVISGGGWDSANRQTHIGQLPTGSPP